MEAPAPTPKEVAKQMIADGKTEGKVKVSYKDMVITRDIKREDFDTFQTFDVDGVRFALGLVIER